MSKVVVEDTVDMKDAVTAEVVLGNIEIGNVVASTSVIRSRRDGIGRVVVVGVTVIEVDPEVLVVDEIVVIILLAG